MSCDLRAYHSPELVSVRIDPQEVAVLNAPVHISPLANWICQEFVGSVAFPMTRSGKPSPFRSKDSTTVLPEEMWYPREPGEPWLRLYQPCDVCPCPDTVVHAFVGANPLP